ncbi:hypothetical protein QYS48_16950 [Marivirga arenosa]|uniref:Uncharacterized protein n=1 Tax=Marivirga arenosa TaxID=3059076 RepID=A0AA49GED3_9BACT|nr:hypothetical protein [Marivirga sp. ABR2-2]WKK83928.1 hypothetical protein QYS48_16950 [Marivirga sp. ABR2-2]
MNTKYWNDKEQKLCTIISTATDTEKCNTAFAELLPQVEKMFDMIYKHYFSNQPQLKKDIDDIRALTITKAFHGLKNGFDSSKPSFSYVQQIIKNTIITHLRKKKYVEVDINEVSENSLLADVMVNRELNHNKRLLKLVDEAIITSGRKQVYVQYLNDIKAILTADYGDTIHHYLITYYLSTKYNGGLRRIYETLYNGGGRKTYGIIKLVYSSNRHYKDFTCVDDIEDFNALNEALHKWDLERC